MRAIFVVLMTISLVACKNDDCCNDVGVDQDWLGKTKADLAKSDLSQYFFIERGVYEGKCVVYVNNCCPMCSTIIVLYTCDGTLLTDRPDMTKLKNVETVWKPDNFSCQVP